MMDRIMIKNLKIIGVVLILGMTLFLFVSVTAQGSTKSGSIKWYAYDEGMSLGKKKGKKIFMFFWAEWCKFCEMMEKETFTKPKVIQYLNDNFVSIKVNSDMEKALASRYLVRGLPTIWFLEKNGDQIGYQPGYIPSNMFLPYLRFIQTDKYKNMSFQDFMKRS